MKTRIVVSCLIGLFLAFVALTLPVGHDRMWIDSVSGSSKCESGLFFFRATPVVQQSALERWIVEHEGIHQPNWKFLSKGDWTILGQLVSRGCSSAPEIFPLCRDNINSLFVQTASDAELTEFVRVMRTGTNTEQRQAVDAAMDLQLKRMSHSPKQ